MPLAWHHTIWWDWCLLEDKKKRIILIDGE